MTIKIIAENCDNLGLIGSVGVKSNSTGLLSPTLLQLHKMHQIVNLKMRFFRTFIFHSSNNALKNLNLRHTFQSNFMFSSKKLGGTAFIGSGLFVLLLVE